MTPENIWDDETKTPDITPLRAAELEKSRILLNALYDKPRLKSESPIQASDEAVIAEEVKSRRRKNQKFQTIAAEMGISASYAHRLFHSQ